MEWMGGKDVDDRKPHGNSGGPDDSGVNSFTNGIMLLSHRSSSNCVSLA
jgi:hypothetical protein